MCIWSTAAQSVTRSSTARLTWLLTCKADHLVFISGYFPLRRWHKPKSDLESRYSSSSAPGCESSFSEDSGDESHGFPCRLCGQTCSSREDLEKHKQREHRGRNPGAAYSISRLLQASPPPQEYRGTQCQVQGSSSLALIGSIRYPRM